ncbi:DUF6198 family protein [bacterium 210820-DFI.6.37]|nr:DUF6198 family protein [bacterium 210820-DFI.6.37]
MTKTELAKRYIIFLIGLYINSFGVSFITKAELGTSPISSIPYVLSLGFGPTLGQFTIFFSLLLIFLQILILGKKFKPADLLQIPVSIIFGYFIDWSMLLLKWIEPELYPYKIIYLLIGCVILGFGVYVEVAANVAMLPGESFVRAVTIRFHTDFGITKVCFDASMALIAAAISLPLFHYINGVREGTIIAALIVGMIAKLFGRLLGPAAKRLLQEGEQREADGLSAEKAAGGGNMIITISREFGSGGREVGKRIAEKLDIAYYDSELVKMAAEESGYTENYVEENEQKLPNHILYDLYTQYYSYEAEEQPKYEALFTAEETVMKELARKGPCVIVGRASNYVFREHEPALHVFISAGMTHKVQRVVRRDGMEPREAERKIRKVDTQRKNHCRYFTGMEWGKAGNYDLTMRTDMFSIEDVAETIAEMATKKIRYREMEEAHGSNHSPR